MRLWSIHPKYLDTKGLVAAWREGLLAKKVLEERTKGYVNHPQLNRFKASSNPLVCINCYLAVIYQESVRRNYHFEKSKIGYLGEKNRNITVTTEQVRYEYELLRYKLQRRNTGAYQEIENLEKIELNPLFIEVPGKIESWEKTISEIVEHVNKYKENKV